MCASCQSPTIYYLHHTVYLSHILLCNCNKCLFISEIASKTELTRETVYHMRQLSRMLMKKGKEPKLGKLDETNQLVIGTLIFSLVKKCTMSCILLSYTSVVYLLLNMKKYSNKTTSCILLLNTLSKNYSNFGTQCLHSR